MISICMITRNKAPFLEISIPAIMHTIASSDFEFLVLDNGSTDGTETMLRNLARLYPMEIHILDENIGLNGYAEIIKFASGDYIATVDDDIFSVTYGWDKYMVDSLRATFGGQKFGYISSDTINNDGGRLPKVGDAIRERGGLHLEVGPAGGWLAMSTSTIVNEVGGFHNDKGIMHLEDLDIQQRIWEAGYLVGTSMNVRVLHARAPYFYKIFDRVDTYLEKEVNAAREGILLEPIT